MYFSTNRFQLLASPIREEPVEDEIFDEGLDDYGDDTIEYRYPLVNEVECSWCGCVYHTESLLESRYIDPYSCILCRSGILYYGSLDIFKMKGHVIGDTLFHNLRDIIDIDVLIVNEEEKRRYTIGSSFVTRLRSG